MGERWLIGNLSRKNKLELRREENGDGKKSIFWQPLLVTKTPELDKKL